jgi:hypothetical protein
MKITFGKKVIMERKRLEPEEIYTRANGYEEDIPHCHYCENPVYNWTKKRSYSGNRYYCDDCTAAMTESAWEARQDR